MQGRDKPCRGGLAVCPMQGNCLDKSTVYKAEVSTAMEKKHYYGLAFRTLKERFYGHQSGLRKQAKADSTTLSKYVWQEWSRGKEPKIHLMTCLSNQTIPLFYMLSQSTLLKRSLQMISLSSLQLYMFRRFSYCKTFELL